VNALLRFIAVLGCVGAGAGIAAAEDPKPKPLPNDIVAAWEKAGGTVGWLEKESFAAFGWNFYPLKKSDRVHRPEGLPGDLPAFQFRKWQPGVLSKLPSPNDPFAIDLSFVPITRDGLKELAVHKHLKRLNLEEDAITDEVLAGVAELKQLEWLNIGETKVTDAGMSSLAGLQHLEYLALPKTVTDAGFKEIRKLTQLRKLSARNSPITDIAAARIAELENLRDLEVTVTKLTDSGFKELTTIGSLRRLFIWDRFDASTRAPNISVRSLFQIRKLTKLEDLTLYSTATTDDVLLAVSRLDNLRHLKINMDPFTSHWITDAGIEHLAGSAKLESLELSNVGGTEKGIRHLAGLKQLRELKLSNCKVTDAGFTRLAGLKKLERLDLEGTAVTDAVLPTIAEFENLTYLRLTGTKVSADGVKLLKKALPKLDISGP
jgi:Leucine-rich repeat (LRR) protein